MIVTDKFVYVHLERTAGTYLSEFIDTFFPARIKIGYHYPRILLPKKYRHLPVIGFVRNPWDWYVSFFYHKREQVERFDSESVKRVRAMKDGTIKVLTDETRRLVKETQRYDDFERATKALLYLNAKESIPFKRMFSGWCPQSIEGNRSMGVTRGELRAFKSNHIGYYSWLFQRMYSDENGSSGDVLYGRYEAFPKELVRLMRLCGVEVTRSMARFLDQHPKRNVSRHEKYQTYFDGQLARELEEREHLIASLFGYKFRPVKTESTRRALLLGKSSGDVYVSSGPRSSPREDASSRGKDATDRERRRQAVPA